MGKQARARVKVDHTAPTLSLSGNLTEQGSLGTKQPEYTLNYSASDGEDAPASAQAPIGTAGTGTGQLERPQGIAVDAAGNVWVTDRVNNRVLQYDKDGNFVRQIGSPGSGDGQMLEPRGIAIAPNGNIWVAEAGNKRLQQFTPTGAFVSKITNTALGTAFSEPWGVATGPEGLLWVTDPGNKKVYRYKEDGTLTRTISNPGGFTAVPYGIDVDAFGNAWVALQGTNQILQIKPNGDIPLIGGVKLGSSGSGNGQLAGPVDIAIARSGNLFVSEDGNSRVQELKPDGSYLRQLGTSGSANDQLKEPRAIAVGPGNTLLIADAGNRRIARWTHADQDPQSGAAKVEIKVDGSTVKTEAPGCSTKNCAIASSWTLDADDYPTGSHKVEVIGTDGVGLTTTKTLNVETHGDRQAPAVTLSGSMTEQGTFGTTRPVYTLKVDATDPGSAEERKSGVAATTIKVDGKVVDSSSPGCPAEGCSLSREWTLNSDSYAAGPHAVEVTATDAAGRSAVKTLEITIARDTTAPVFNLSNTFYTAPEGWLEQKTYNYNATATDADGYGVTSMTLKIDGTVIKTGSQTCPTGGCSKLLGLFTSIDMSKYDGGAHPAELIATDGAGNTRKRSWTINVVPKGEIPAVEATDTLEALEETTEVTPVASAEELLEPEQMEYGDNPSLVNTENGIESNGVPTGTSISEESAAITIAGPEDSLTIEPVDPPGGKPSTVIAEGLAAVLTGVQENTDSIVRPQYNGAMQFSQIRDASSPETYSWELKLDSDQYLVLANEDQAEVRYEGGTTAYLITAELAHDATGKAVETSFGVAGKVITLKVNHRVPGVVYPVLAGQSYETSYETGTVAMPPPEPPPPPAADYFTEAEAAQVIASDGVGNEIIPAPEPSQAGDGATASSIPEKVVQPYRRCSVLGCGVWWVEMRNPSYHYKRTEAGRATAYWQGGTQVHGESWRPWYYFPELEVHLCGAGFNQPYQVWAGEQKHLTVWLRSRITAYAFTIDGDVLDFDNRLAMQIWVWPNGFQQRVHGHWEPTQEWIENGGACAVEAM